MFPLEMTRSPSAPFISKWNNFSTAAFFFFPHNTIISLQYTTPAPLFISLLPPDSLVHFFLFSFSVFLVLSAIGVVSEHVLSDSAFDMAPLQRSYSYYVKEVLGKCARRSFSRLQAFKARFRGKSELQSVLNA